MARCRTVLVGLGIALAMSTAGACGPVNELIADRDLACEGTPDDICIRLADEVARDIARGDPGGGELRPRRPEGRPVVKVTVTARECTDNEAPRFVRCWRVEAETRPDASGQLGRFGGQVYERRDGTLLVRGWAGVTLRCGDPDELGVVIERDGCARVTTSN